MIRQVSMPGGETVPALGQGTWRIIRQSSTSRVPGTLRNHHRIKRWLVRARRTDLGGRVFFAQLNQA